MTPPAQGPQARSMKSDAMNFEFMASRHGIRPMMDRFITA
jgi:hypothetical protein